MKTYKNRDGGIETSEELKQKYIPEGSPFINEVVPDTVMFPVSKVLFERYEFNAPHDVDEYLRSVYGSDYMTLPSVYNRDCHDIIEYKVYK